MFICSDEWSLYCCATGASVFESVKVASRAEITSLAEFAESFTPITQVLPLVNALLRLERH